MRRPNGGVNLSGERGAYIPSLSVQCRISASLDNPSGKCQKMDTFSQQGRT
jgi:hypothetical protein